jgi:hypothetical protein
MSYLNLLDDQEAAAQAGTTGDGVVVPPGSAVPAAEVLATGAPIATKVDPATGQPVIDTKAVDQNTGMAKELQTDAVDASLPAPPRTGYEAVEGRQRSDANDLDKRTELQKIVHTLKDYGLGADTVDPTGGTASGLPDWYHNAKLRGDRIPGSKNSHYVLDEATWEPPKEQRIGKGIANMIANMSTAGSRLAMGEKERPLGLRMKDAKRVALGEGAASLADMFIDRKNLRYQDLLKTAKEESEIEKNRNAGKASKSGSAASRMNALTSAAHLIEGDITGQRLGKKADAEAEEVKMDNDPNNPKAERLRQTYLAQAAGWLKDSDIPHASYAELLAMRPQIGAAIEAAHKDDNNRISREWEVWKMHHQSNLKNDEEWKKKEQEFSNRRRDYWLEDGMFWKHGVPPKETKEYEDIRSYIQINNQILMGLSKLSDIQRELQSYGPLYGAGGEVIKNLGRFMGDDGRAQDITLLGFQWASELRDLIRKKNNFGVPQAWEQELLRTRVLEPGSIMAWLQGTKNFDSLYELHKESGRQWLRDKGRIGFTDEENPGENWVGTAPARISEPIVRDRNGQPIMTWEQMKDQGKDVLEQLEKPNGRRLSPEEVKIQQESDAAARKEKYGTIDSMGKTGEVPAVPPAVGETTAVTFGDNDMSDQFKAFVVAFQHAADKGIAWTEKQAAEWKARAEKTNDPIFKRFVSLPLDTQMKLVTGSAPVTADIKPDGTPVGGQKTEPAPETKDPNRKVYTVHATEENLKPRVDKPRKWHATVHGKDIEIPNEMTSKQASDFIKKARIRAKDPKASINEVKN